MIQPDLSEFLEKAKQGNLIPIRKEIFADFETPVSAYCKIRKGPSSFLLESVEQAEIIGRYSFIGTDPRIVISSRGGEVTLTENGDVSIRKLREGEDPLHILQEVMYRYRVVPDPDLPPFFGGLVGYVGYDTVAFFEDLNLSNEDRVSAPDCLFVLADSVVAFDRVRQTLQIVVNAMIEGDPQDAYSRAVEQIEDLESRLLAPVEVPTFGAGRTKGLSIEDNRTREDYCQAVRRAKDYIIAGDAFQIVLSLNRRMEIEATPLDFYRALRRLNPSPYMFLLENEECSLVGSSPEILVRLTGGKVQYRPIAGTRPRGKTREEDAELEKELLADPKERAEHIMLVDLGRNDIGRVCEFNTVRVTDLMVVERYSHVMHIVSNVEGNLLPGKSQFDLLRAAFPAGTLTGAPKIRAMEIIEELEPTKRGPYGGAVGYFGFGGNLDTCITIRTIVVKDGIAAIQAGAGIVYDSVPESEYQECMNKSRGMIRAIEIAERGEF